MAGDRRPTRTGYLIDQIERNPGIVVWPSTRVTALTETSRLEVV